MPAMPKSIQINEEGPREGFQIEKAPISIESKVALIDALSETGLKNIQTVSFVSPKAVPQMADADEVVARINMKAGVKYTGLWLNDAGLRRAIATGRLSITGKLSLSGSEAFSKRNQNRNSAENIAAQHTLIKTFKEHSIGIELASIQAAFGCNFQGVVTVPAVVDLVRQLQEIATEHSVKIEVLTLADTMAWATPTSVKNLVGALQDAFPSLRLALHLHDTRGMALANAYAGLQMGVDVFDSAVAGLGGCPFAEHKGAAGNICTEDLVFMCEEMGIETGVNLERLIEVARMAEEIVGHPLPGSVKTGGSLRVLREKIARAA